MDYSSFIYGLSILPMDWAAETPSPGWCKRILDHTSGTELLIFIVTRTEE